ncbi:MAG TPA: AzlD domain-containing protein [Actinomycetota bacterium]|nr:AzlD domain-containing protein [Actinomycetota bacterium]
MDVEVRPEILLVIAGAGVVTLIPRVAPMLLLQRIRLPEWALRWLGLVPISVLAALLAQEVVVPSGEVVMPPDNLAPIAIVPPLAVAAFTRSLVGTVVTGVVAMALLRGAL